MKQFISTAQSPQNIRLFIQLYQKDKGWVLSDLLSYGQIIELRLAVSGKLHHDEEDEDGKFYNNVLYGEESVIGWDGNEPIEIEYYQLEKEIKQFLIRHSKLSS